MKRQRRDLPSSELSSWDTRRRLDSPDTRSETQLATEVGPASSRRPLLRSYVTRPRPITVFMGTGNPATLAGTVARIPRASAATTLPQPTRRHRPPLQRSYWRGPAEAPASDFEAPQTREPYALASNFIEVVNLPATASDDIPMSVRLMELCNPVLARLTDYEDDADSDAIVTCWTRPRSSMGIFTHTLVVELQNCALACSATRVLDGLRFLDKQVEARIIVPP
jgi:hypothetical protein